MVQRNTAEQIDTFRVRGSIKACREGLNGEVFSTVVTGLVRQLLAQPVLVLLEQLADQGVLDEHDFIMSSVRCWLEPRHG